nr:MAG TPA: hypothetical protein [Caudoviricetes sp.]
MHRTMSSYLMLIPHIILGLVFLLDIPLDRN